jgi:predicted polyphosphate/ATP-dependent NAD kinase
LLQRKKVGLIVNPVAGMGGRVGLKGTDGVSVIAEARLLGATPESPQKASEALKVIFRIKNEIELWTYPGEMGEDIARDLGFVPKVIGSIVPGQTTSEDTRRASLDLKGLGVNLLLFAGGDGTARDIYRAIGHSREMPVLGIPTGVKMHSAVFALNSRTAGEIAVSFLLANRPNVIDAEVMDIDENSFRKGVIAARLYGYLQVPEERQLMQSVKSGGIQTEKQVIQGIAAELRKNGEKDCAYFYGPGTTTRDILAEFGLEKTLLGVDVVLGHQIIAKDVNEQELHRLIDGRKEKSKIVVSVIGKQGYIFGRGNQQLSREIIKKVGRENIVVVASKQKLASLEGKPLLVDTGSEEVDKMLSGYMKVITGYEDYVVYKVGLGK